MKIKPVGNKIYIDVDEPKVGVLDTSSRPSAIEFGTVLDVGPEVTLVKKGDFIFFKSWAVDIVTYNEKRYQFISEKSEGICAIINK